MGDLYHHKRIRLRGKVDTPLDEKLKNVEWGEFRVGNLFEISNTLSFNKDKLTDGSEYDYVTRTSQNQGVLQKTGFVNQENLNPAGNWSVGLLQMDFFYRQNPWYAGQFVRKITPKIIIPKKAIPFFTTSLNKLKDLLLSGLVRDVDRLFKNAKIQLPIKNGEIYFEFMEDFIAQIETERIERLNKYLEENGLKDYTLNDEEKKALETLRKDKIYWEEFKLGNLFEVSSYKKRFDANKVTISNRGKPYVVRTSLYNGIRGYINEDEKYLNEGNTISFGQDTATMFYQAKPYFTGDKIKILKEKNEKLNRLNGLFFVSTMTKSFSSFSWGGSSFNVDIIQSQPIILPSKNNQPDYQLMETLISAIQKLVIKDVVLYVEKKLGYGN